MKAISHLPYLGRDIIHQIRKHQFEKEISLKVSQSNSRQPEPHPDPQHQLS